MFISNNTGVLERHDGTYDAYGQPKYATGVSVRCGVVRLIKENVDTSVRTDSSATRGNAEEEVMRNAKILFPASVAPKRGDKFTIYGITMKIISLEPRIRVTGALDHYECTLENF